MSLFSKSFMSSSTKQVVGSNYLAFNEIMSLIIFRPNRYHLLEHNCNTFSSEVAQFLTGKDIPSNITGLPAEVLST